MNEPTTYEEYLAYSQKMQCAYIVEERKRCAKLQKLWNTYKTKAAKLGLHPLDRREIEARFDQLNMMERRIVDTHGDTPAQRSLWEMRQRERAAA